MKTGLVVLKIKYMGITTYKGVFCFNTFFNLVKEKKKKVRIVDKKITELQIARDSNNTKLMWESIAKTDSDKKPYLVRTAEKKGVIHDNPVVSYVIYIKPSKVNLFMGVMDCWGNTLKFYSAGSVGFKGRAKRAFISIIKQVYRKFLRHLYFLENQPVALHLININKIKTFAIKYFATKFHVTAVKLFTTTSYNGLRRGKKIPRKKVRTRKQKRLTRLMKPAPLTYSQYGGAIKASGTYSRSVRV